LGDQVHRRQQPRPVCHAGESSKAFYDPLIKRDVKWEQDVYCPTFTVFEHKLYCVYRSWGEDEQWRMGLAWSEDGLRFTRSDKPVFYAKPEDQFLGSLRYLKDASVSYGDSGSLPRKTAPSACFSTISASGRSTISSSRSHRARNMTIGPCTPVFAKQAGQDVTSFPRKPRGDFLIPPS